MIVLAPYAYLFAGVCFILALRGLSHPTTARRGNVIGMLGMGVAIGTVLLSGAVQSYILIVSGLLIGGIIGSIVALRIKMTALPQLVAAFHSLVGLAAVLVAAAAFVSPETYGIGQNGSIAIGSLIEIGLGSAIGAITFTGSLIAFGKLQALLRSAPLVFFGQHIFNLLIVVGIIVCIILLCLTQAPIYFWSAVALSLLLGLLLILPIGGADMPVVVSMLNSYSGWAACGIGFTLGNMALVITGALVGASGAILSYIMCKGMNRSIFNVILGGFGAEVSAESMDSAERGAIRSGNADDAAFIMGEAESVIIVPGYGMAVAQAQHALREMVELLKAKGVKVRYAIHPVAGRMPGHMNVLLAEARVPYEEVFELDEINRDFSACDVAFVIGANDVTNPSAKSDTSSPIYGMPILDVEKAKTVLFVKRSMGAGYAGVENELFFRDNTMMLFADAKDMCEHIIRSLN